MRKVFVASVFHKAANRSVCSVFTNSVGVLVKKFYKVGSKSEGKALGLGEAMKIAKKGDRIFSEKIDWEQTNPKNNEAVKAIYRRFQASQKTINFIPHHRNSLARALLNHCKVGFTPVEKLSKDSKAKIDEYLKKEKEQEQERKKK